MTKFLRIVPFALIATVALALAGCEGIADEPKPEVVMPKLIGTALDKAKSQLDDAGFDDVDADDAAEDRAIIIDSNWVVVSQNIKPGQKVPKSAPIKLGAAKPDDAKYAELLAKAGETSALDEQRATERAQADAKHDACNLLRHLRVNSEVFDDELQAPKSSIDDYENGFRSVELACANKDTGITISARTWPTAAGAIDEANHNVRIGTDNPQARKLLIGDNGTEVAYPEGGGYVINPDTGTSHQSFVVGTWRIYTELLFLDVGVSRIRHQPNPVPSVISLLDQIKARATQVIPSGQW